MSYMESVITPMEVACLAENSEFSAIAITDCNSVQAFLDVYEKAKRKGVANKIIYGAIIECFYRESYSLYSIHLLILAKNQTGLKTLYRILSSMNEIKLCEPKFVSEHREGLIIGIITKNTDKLDKYLRNLKMQHNEEINISEDDEIMLVCKECLAREDTTF